MEEIRDAQTLRFEVFNLELNEGLEQSYATGLDQDPFDAVCDHLLVEHLPSKQVVGTYRFQTGANAARNLGYYCEQEFEFEVYRPLRDEIVELGRACVHQQHRNLSVLGLLWKGIAEYARARRARYFFGCSSITSQEPAIWGLGLCGIMQEIPGRPAIPHSTAHGIRLPVELPVRGTAQNPQTASRLFEHRRQNLRSASPRPAIQDD